MKIDEVNWIREFQGKTLQSVRTRHEDDGPIPFVAVYFTDGSAYHLHVKDDVFFEAAMFNGLRKAQPVEHLSIRTYGRDTTVEVRCKTFPLFLVRAVDTKRQHQFPFELERMRGAQR